MRFVFALLCLMTSAMAQTNVGFLSVSGTVRLTKAQSPVTFSQIQINSGTLIVDPGVELIAAASSSIITLRNGSASVLSIQGTELEPVLIRPAGAFAWRGLSNISRSTRPRFEIANAMILGLGGAARCVDLVSAEVNFANSVFQGARTTATGSPTIGLANSLSVGLIDNCLIDGFTTGSLVNRNFVIRDTDFRNTVTPLTVPQTANVTISLAIE